MNCWPAVETIFELVDAEVIAWPVLQHQVAYNVSGGSYPQPGWSVLGIGFYLAFTDFRSFFISLSFSVHSFYPASGIPRKLIFLGPHTLTQIKGAFSVFYTASFWSLQPGPTLVPGILLLLFPL